MAESPIKSGLEKAIFVDSDEVQSVSLIASLTLPDIKMSGQVLLLKPIIENSLYLTRLDLSYNHIVKVE
jgi:CBS-domain-containing membrane protein